MDESRRCERCDLTYQEKDFRGRVCGWCADNLERADQADQPEGQR